jgi:membrane protease YdiL (CAAX protease family)
MTLVRVHPMWNKFSLLRLLSGLILVFGVSNLVGLLLQTYIPAPSGASPQMIPATFLAATLTLHLGALWVFQIFLRDESLTWKEFLNIASPGISWAIPLAILAGGASLLPLGLVSQFSTWFWKQLHHAPSLQAPLELLKSIQHPVPLCFFAVTAVVTAPLLEEIFFRGVLFHALEQRGWGKWAWLATAVLFGMIHLDREKFLPLTVFGLFLVWIYQRTRTLLAPILTHATFNLINLVLFLKMDAAQQIAK